jgi:hypothetical protein
VKILNAADGVPVNKFEMYCGGAKRLKSNRNEKPAQPSEQTPAFSKHVTDAEPDISSSQGARKVMM